MKPKQKAVLGNRAELREEKPQDHMDCERCDEQLIFHMKDNYHDFSIGVETILNCLKLAEEKGAIPQLPGEWWINVGGRYEIYRKGR